MIEITKEEYAELIIDREKLRLLLAALRATARLPYSKEDPVRYGDIDEAMAALFPADNARILAELREAEDADEG